LLDSPARSPDTQINAEGDAPKSPPVREDDPLTPDHRIHPRSTAMKRSPRFALLAGLLLLPDATAAADSDGRPMPTPDNFAKFHAFLRPRPAEEKWLQIPWMTDLWEARKKAAAEGKPMLLWEMDGSPMACG
jgi:hypothetical protein